MSVHTRKSFYLECQWCDWHCTVSKDPEAWAAQHIQASGTYHHQVNITECTVVENVATVTSA